MSSLPVARLFGLEIRVHVSWTIILAAIAVTVAAQIADVAPAVPVPARWFAGTVVALAFLASAIAHELGHALVARRAGIAGGPVVVYFFGGAASPSTEAGRPRDEIVAALAGPLVSLGIGVVLLGVAVAGVAVGRGLGTAIGQLALVVGVMNLVLGGVNLVPAFPLDGGRVVRGIAWARTGDAGRGLRIAGRIGRWTGLALAVLGMALILAVDSVDGLMLGLCGWFLVSSARAVERAADVDDLLAGIHVADVMDRDVTGVPAALTLDTFAEQVLEGAGTSVPVMRGAELLGILGARQVRRIRRDRWADTRAGDLMAAADSLPSIGPETTLRAALDHLQRTGLDGLPVLDGGALTGIVTRRAVAEVVRSRVASARGGAS